ncbi:MAG: hypothetical protein U0900_23100 [Myxococcota bacterium]
MGVLSYQIIGGVCAVFFLGCSVGAFLARQYPPIAIFGFFLLMGLYMLLFSGSYELDDVAIHHKSLLGHFRMQWSEVKRVEIGTQGSLVLHGDGKRFSLPPASYWSGKQKPEAFELLKRKLESSAAPTHQSSVGDYKIHKNVRVRPGEA